MSVADRLKNRVRVAVDTVVHSYDYSRHLVRGNKVSSDMSWSRPDTPPVVLVHGFMGTRGTMLPLTRRFQRDGRVVFSYAYGKFNFASMRRSAEDLTEQLRAICETLELPRVDLVGYSMGGLIGLHTVKFLQGHRYVRNLVMMGSPLRGSWLGYAGVATMGAISPSVWQVLPGSPFLEDLANAPVPKGVRMRQIHAASDVICPPPGPIEGVAPRDYVMLPGAHSSLVVAEPFYRACSEFLDADPQRARPATDGGGEWVADFNLDANDLGKGEREDGASAADEDGELEYSFEPTPSPGLSSMPDWDAAE